MVLVGVNEILDAAGKRLWKPDAIVDLNTLSILNVNERISDVLGYPLEDIEGAPMDHFFILNRAEVTRIFKSLIDGDRRIKLAAVNSKNQTITLTVEAATFDFNDKEYLIAKMLI